MRSASRERLRAGRAGGFGATDSTGLGTSRTTSRAFLSWRSPWKEGWRRRPSLVHSVNATSATSSGRTQCARVTPGMRERSKGEVGCARAASRRRRSSSSFEVKPVPTLPANSRRPSGSWTPMSSAPRPTREPSGSV